MVDRHSKELLDAILPAATRFAEIIPNIKDGRDAALATVTLMAYSAETLPPSTPIDEYIRLGGGTSVKVVDGLWDAFGKQTAAVMGAGARYLAAIWDAALAAAGTDLPDENHEIPKRTSLLCIRTRTSFRR
ncbi:hypothetical protein [Paraburkholderia sp. J11-2]|uniref:hypothetical protein n=1 Tax=Paraburkholderia sp. J11-2 TaxID=2805431 RepID=UPI002AB7A48C|nr:hypothetical protein [Paraburkholderia sp. J11-2]